MKSREPCSARAGKSKSASDPELIKTSLLLAQLTQTQQSTGQQDRNWIGWRVAITGRDFHIPAYEGQRSDPHVVQSFTRRAERTTDKKRLEEFADILQISFVL
jgi:hypothetical protein